ncbi:MAG: putative phage abortive infection protein [Methylobacter sp.]|jgi:hypothetical protein|uniref:putative phage abortive infection protein n=1 Tax=Methylobacter sp. TaxID=2051955 RepID=UPI0025EB5138|nr:putative phage abortive infection protein [Methylobacter sp.]MCK9621273.1 putative phage abortive infection protein [Methylobacter sp.]
MCKIAIITKFIYRKFLNLIGRTEDKTSRNLFELVQLASGATLVVFLISLMSLFGESSYGTFGDFFGGILNPILTFLTFLGLLITIVLQKKELALTRQELHTSALALSQQVETQEKQRFEDTFFALLEQHNRLLDKIVENSVSYDSEGTPGNTASIVEHSMNFLIGNRDYYPLFENNLNLQESKAKLLTFKPILNQYFRVLYQILKFVASNCPASTVKGKFHRELLSETECSQEEKLYANIVRSFLSEDIYYLLAINCFCEDQSDHFIEYKILVERYSFFEHMPINVPKTYNANIIQEIVDHYSDKAFGKNVGVQ